MAGSMYHIPGPHETLFTISLAWGDGSEECNCLICLPENVVNTLLSGERQARVEIWKHFGRPSGIGIESMGRSQLCLRLPFPHADRPAADGSQDQKPPKSYWQLVTSYISGGLSFWRFTPAPDPASSSVSNGTK